MKPKNRIFALLGSTIVLSCATAQAADVTLIVNDGFGASSFASAGNTQQETATVVGTVTTAGNLLVTVTSANVVGSPLAFSVPVLVGDAPNAVATKIRTALSANPALAAQFNVGGTNAAVQLTGNVTNPIPANDATLNIAIANDTAAGITPVVNSANTRGATRAWTDGFAPKAGNAYFTGSNLLRTNLNSALAPFAGDSLELSPRSLDSLLLKGGGTTTFTINDLRLNGGLLSHGDSNAIYTIAGNMSVNAISGFGMGINDPVAGGATRTLNLNSVISGANRLHIGTITGTPTNQGIVTVSGNNSAFSGGFTLGGSYTNAVNTTFSFNPANSTLKVNHVNALGTGTLTIDGGSLDLNGFSPTISNFTGSAGTVLTNVAGTAVLTIGNNDATGGNFAGNVTNGTGTVGITKTGTGSLILSGTSNTYTGDTTVNGGTLSVPASQTGAGNVIVADGASFGVNVASNGEALAVNTLTSGVSTGSTLILNSGTTGNPSAAPISADILTVDAPTVLKLQGTALTVANGIPLLAYGSVGGTSGLAGLSLQLPARTFGSIDTSTSGLVKANITSFEQIKWVGNVSSVWDFDPTGTGVSGTLNWKTTSTNVATRYLQGTGGIDSVNFDDSATGSTAITINGANVSPAGLVFNNSSKNYSFSGANGIAGTTSLTKGGTGSVTLGTPNSFSGGINLNDGTLALAAANTISGVIDVNAGTLAINHANALGTTSLNLEDDAILDNTSGSAVTLATVNAQTWNGDLTFTGSNDLSLGIGAVSMPFGSAVTTTAGNLTIGGIISGAGSTLTKKGNGTLTLNGANTHSGGTTIEAGTLATTLPLENITLATAFNTLGTGTVDISAGALLTINATTYKSTFANDFSGAGTVNISSYVADAPAGNYTGDVTLSGDWSAFTGDLNLSTPTGKENRVFANFGGTLISPAAEATVSVGVGTTLWLSGFGQDLLSAIEVSGNGNTENRGALRLDSVNLTGPVKLTGDATVGSSVGSVTQSISGVISGAFQLASAPNGGRTIILSGNNTYSGGTLIQGCPFEARHNNAFGTGTVTIASTPSGNVGRAVIGDTFTVANAINLTGTQAGTGRGLLEGPASGTGTVTGPITISATTASGGHFASTGGTLVVQGAVTSSVPVIVRAGDVTFSGGGSYSALNIDADTTRAGAANGISTSAVVNLGTGAAATLDLNGFNQQLAGLTRLSGTNTVTVTNSGAPAVLTVDTTGTPSYPGDVSGALSLVKSGSGTQTISGAVSYSGDTTVSDGILSIAAVNAANESSTVNIGASATLNLTFAGTDTVDKLFVGGVQKSPGVYEAIGNPGSGIEIAQITGSGTLTVTSGPAGGNYASWASANGATADATADHDNDGVENGIEYFMGQSGSGFTSLPVPDSSGKVSWPKDPAYSGTFAVQTSPNLSAWTTQTHSVNGNLIEYTLPSGQGKLFVRLIVDPN
jgi:autotransporter-associated beta strand protein